MGKILLICFAVIVVFIIGYIFFGGKKTKKKKEKQEPAAEKKIEKAIKTGKEDKSEQPKEEKQEEKKEEKRVEQPSQDAQKGFRIIRKKSEVKINKKALKNGSRNPSVTKVFDKNGAGVDESKEEEPITNEEELKKDIKEMEPKQPERFGTREVDYEVVNNGVEFSIKNPIGGPNRAPIIQDRTNFATHLNVSEDGNLSGISGTGINKVIKKIEKQTESVDDSTENMVQNIRRNFLGIEEDVDPFEMLNRRRMGNEEKAKQESPLKKIDAETLIIADAISNPKYKKTNKNE